MYIKIGSELCLTCLDNPTNCLSCKNFSWFLGGDTGGKCVATAKECPE